MPIVTSPAGRRIRNMQPWADLVERIRRPAGEVTIGIVGKYVELQDSYKSLNEALTHAGLANNLKVNLGWIEAEGLAGEKGTRPLENVDGILVPGGFGKGGNAGMPRPIA